MLYYVLLSLLNLQIYIDLHKSSNFIT